MNILITRIKEQAKELNIAVKNAGFKPLLLPTLTIKKLSSNKLDNNTTIVIFISVNAVETGYHLLKNTKVKVVAVGGKTAEKLISKNIKVAFYPNKNPSSTSLIAMSQMQNLKNENIVIIRGLSGEETLKASLDKNNSVSYREVYERIVTTKTPQHQKIIDTFLKQENGAIIITSVANIQALLKIIQSEKILNYPVVAVSERIKKVALSMGFAKCFVTQDITNESILESIKSL